MRVLGVASLKVVLSDGQLHDGVCLGCARVDLRDKMCADAAVPPCALVSCSTSALLEDEWGVVQAVASLSLRLLDLGPSVLPHLIAAPLQQVSPPPPAPPPPFASLDSLIQLQIDHQPQPGPASAAGTVRAVSLRESGSDLRLRDVAVGSDAVDILQQHIRDSTAQPPAQPISNTGISPAINGHHESCSAVAEHARPLPPLAARDIWTIRGGSGQPPQPPPLFLSKA
jgi:hypothetical protein